MVINLFLFLGVFFLLTFLLGMLIEKIRVPWIFSALLLGAVLACYNPFPEIISSPIFKFLAQLGMYFLLFIIGFELNMDSLRKRKSLIIKGLFLIVVLEGAVGSIVVHYAFHYSWFISLIVAMSFATVGEAILVPILDEFKIINTKLGQMIIGIGTLDDIIELITLIIVVFMLGAKVDNGLNVLSASILFVFLIFLFLLFRFFKKRNKGFAYTSVSSLLLFCLFVFFVFIGIGEYLNAAAIAAVLAGITLRSFLPKIRLDKVKSEIKAIAYGFFAPIFFLSVGAEMNMSYLIKYPLMILLVVAVSKVAKLFGSYLVGRKELGFKRSMLLGIGLSVRFSTSIIIIQLLYDNGIVGSDIYSVIIASSIVFKFIIPVLFSNLLVRWRKLLEPA